VRSIRNAVVLNFSAPLPKSEATFSNHCRKIEMIARFAFTQAHHRAHFVGNLMKRVSIDDCSIFLRCFPFRLRSNPRRAFTIVRDADRH
jgi:hypothetical protein